MGVPLACHITMFSVGNTGALYDFVGNNMSVSRGLLIMRPNLKHVMLRNYYFVIIECELLYIRHGPLINNAKTGLFCEGSFSCPSKINPS